MQTVEVPASMRLRKVASSSTLPFGRRVDPKATSVELVSCSSVPARAKNSMSFGLAPGHPPSMYPTPSWSSCSAMRSLSSTVADTPSTWRPSRKVVSKISIHSPVMCLLLLPRNQNDRPLGRSSKRTSKTTCATK